jgi:alginate O-acetyltransferase complex protein AlgI
MLFASAEYLLVFLPLVFILYYWLLSRKIINAAKSWLVLSSLFFYGWWNPVHVPLIIGSIVANFLIGNRLVSLARETEALRLKRIGWFATGVVFNIGLLGYFKYAAFFLENLQILTGNPVSFDSPVLPLAISFFTFTQIAYLADCYKGEVKDYKFSNYVLFVTFFPHLIAGPIVHHREIMPQFAANANFVMRYRNVLVGLILIAIGLGKKVLIADTLARGATAGFDHAETLNFVEAWITSLSYTFQLYFDFSGYTDMALGAALLFNIRMPINFNSPYRASDIRDFWRRWHISLSRFLRDYIYIPLGGSRAGEWRTSTHLLVTFLLGGLWHGASWMFVIWGGLHGLAIVAHRLWMKVGWRMPYWLGWFVTFNFINVTWVFFRAKDIDAAFKVLQGMASVGSTPALINTKWDSVTLFAGLNTGTSQAMFGAVPMVVILTLAFVIVLNPFNSTGRWIAPGAWRRATPLRIAVLGSLGASALMVMLASPYSEFIYFNF